MIAQLTAAWRRTRHALHTPRLWHAMLQTAGALGLLWIAALLAWHGYHHLARAGSGAAAPKPSAPDHAGDWREILLGTLVGVLGLGVLVAVPEMTGALYGLVAAVVAGRTGVDPHPRGYWWIRGLCWIGSFIAYGVVAGVAAMIALAYDSRLGLVLVALATWGTLPFLLRWFGGLFTGRGSVGQAGRASFHTTAYPTLVVGSGIAVVILGVGTGIGWALLRGLGWPAWISTALSFLTVDVVLDLALTAWYLALYTVVTESSSEYLAERLSG